MDSCTKKNIKNKEISIIVWSFKRPPISSHGGCPMSGPKVIEFVAVNKLILNGLSLHLCIFY